MSSKLVDTDKAENLKKLQSLAPLAKVAAVIALLLLVLGLVGIDGHYVGYYNKWVECGERPVGTRGSGFYNVGVPHYEQVELFRPFHGHISYFCSSLEAEKRGYSANPARYDFPELKKEYGTWCRHEGDPESETAAIFSMCDPV